MIKHKYNDNCNCNKCNDDWMKVFIVSLNKNEKIKKDLYLTYLKQIEDEFKEERKEFIKWFRKSKHRLSYGWIREYLKDKNTNHVKMIISIANYFLDTIYPNKKLQHNERVDFHQIIRELAIA